MPPQVLKIKSLVYQICDFDSRTKQALDAGFKRKCTDTRTYRTNALRKAFGPDEKKEAEIYLYEDHVKYIEDHVVSRVTFVYRPYN